MDSSYSRCYRCGLQIFDAYPSTLCAACRREITQPIYPMALAQRLTVEDIRWLRGMKVRIDTDMLTLANRPGLKD